MTSFPMNYVQQWLQYTSAEHVIHPFRLGGGGAHCVCTGKTRMCIVFVCACAQGPWRGYRDGRLHQAGDSTSGLQFQELLYWDGV